MKYEKTIKGNPQRLTIKQHIFPYRSIQRFISENSVEVYLKSEKTYRRLKPNNALFCVSRVWDQRAETGYMKEIEDAFQQIADKISSNSLDILCTKDHLAITSMYLLWNLRYDFATIPSFDSQIRGVNGLEVQLTKYDEEVLEKNHISFIREDGMFPSRQRVGIMLQRSLDRELEKMHNLKWGILTSKRFAFLVPDHCKNYLVMPVSPYCSLLASYPNMEIDDNSVLHINRLLEQESSRYHFAQHYHDCGLERIE